MKKIITILALMVITVAVQSQNPFHGFFKSTKALTCNYLLSDKGTSTNQWLFRPEIAITAAAIEFDKPQPVIQAFNSFGVGLSYASINNSTGYCNFSANLALLTKIKIGETINTDFGLAATADVYNKFFGIGIGWIPGHFYLLNQISINF